MAISSYNSALQMAESLSPEQQLRLIHELTARISKNSPSEERVSLLDLGGLGAELWDGIDAQEYVHGERSSWNG